MDWTKAKTIIIGVLLVANIFLLYLFIDKEKQPAGEMLEEETMALLEAKQIFVEKDLPQEGGKMPVLMVEYSKIDRTFIKEKISAQSERENYSGTEEEDLAIADNFLAHCKIEYDTAVFWEYTQEELEGEIFSTVFYINQYKGIRVEDSYIACRISNGMVVDVDIFWLKPLGQGKAKKSTISPSAALIELMRNKDGKESILVNNIEMVYWLDPSFPPGETAVSDTALPTWKIEYNDGLNLYVPAYTD